jgi:hypothetical protein
MEAVSTPEPAMGNDFKEQSVAVPRKCQALDKLGRSIQLMDELALIYRLLEAVPMHFT